MTEKIFYKDVNCKEFQAIVTDCRETKKGFEISLDRSAFYPEGGGQPGDKGLLVTSKGEEIIVSDTHEKEGDIYLTAGQSIAAGTYVTGKINWDHRFDLMQNHSGEHIVSGLIHQRFGYNNVGFHMGKDLLTIDLDGEISWQELCRIEEEANSIVWQDLPVKICTYNEEEVQSLSYRSKKELHGQVRIVTFPGADVCACCGTHVTHTGQIGLIKFLTVQKFKGGVRIEMLCGKRAYDYMNRIFLQNHEISVALSARPLETAKAVERLKAAEAEASFRLTSMENQAFKEKAESLAGRGSVLLFEENLSPDSLRRLCAAVMETCCGRCAVFSGDDENGYKYAIGQENGDLRAFTREMNAALNGRGGGKPFFVQGSVNVPKRKIQEFLAITNKAVP